MATSFDEKNLGQSTFEQKWEIRNWDTVLKNKTLIENTISEIECQVEKVVCAKFMIGLKVVQDGNQQFVRFYWKLLHKHFYSESVQADLFVECLYGNGETWRTSRIEANAEIGKDLDIKENIWYFPPSSSLSTYINPEGSWTCKLKVTLKNLQKIIGHSKEQEFELVYKNQFTESMAALVNNKSSSDIKFFTKEKTELFAHKAILIAHCPVFASMFGSDSLEGSTSVVNIDDISTKTMKLLLHFWYTGELLPSWKDNDIIAEFTYAAGKYQMTQVLKMLDGVLKWDLQGSDLDVELLRIVTQLSLENAEARIMKLVLDKVNQVKSGEELLGLFSLTPDNFNGENFTLSQALKACDDVLSEENFKDACSSDVELMALACKNGVKNVENKLLGRIIDTVNKVTSAEKLFALFDTQTEKYDDVSETSDMLVRANLK